MKLIFATHNPGKLKEMKDILKGLAIEVQSADQAGVTEEVVEDGKTFAENALKKARFVTEKTGQWAVADDSGICIKALNNAPGVFSTRWAGESASPEKLRQHTLSQMKNIPESNRQAWMESVAALTAPDGRHWLFTGKVEGVITLKPAGQTRKGMPYDAIFIPRGHSRTFAEMSSQEKNALSHRGIAFGKLRKRVDKRLYMM